jgi:hypothetical protein
MDSRPQQGTTLVKFEIREESLMLLQCMPRFTVDDFYRVWAVAGPLAGVGLGAWLTARWQRKKWILDNKLAEYRGILDALSS